MKIKGKNWNIYFFKLKIEIYNYNDFAKLVFFRKFIPKKIRSFLSEKLRKFYGTNLMDKQLLEYLNYNDGFFIELGVHDGLTESNTKYFEKFKIKTTTLNDLMDEFKCPQIIDLLSFDTEGTELEVLKGINFQKYKFRFIVVENRNFNELEFFFKTKNYSFIKKLSNHDYLFKSN